MIIHLACSVLKAGSDRDAMVDLDYTGTARLLEQHRQLRQQGKRGRFIFISSQSAGPDAANDYGRSKWAIERLVTGKDEIIVRPGLVYSGAGGSVFGVLEKLARLPVVPTPDAPPNIQPIGVEELAEALDRIARHTTPDRKYNLGRTEPLTFTQTLYAIAARSARRGSMRFRNIIDAACQPVSSRHSWFGPHPAAIKRCSPPISVWSPLEAASTWA
ncbi:3-beta-hydroxy-delta(5)-steroid dehydrogenase [Komagataeibacter intermedius AF2]|uniref:3-beta-hydroxy-delta(5)-steroid dehydrogenase n=1 Tax=Komagataeibacter intermedius AF2 TaxID=1458464 RepID=A0A0C1V4A9_9PROT|nr:3-beta-hydroxy-delta(5)-steroid dehydrogenase [Komagataeibacter intermedius AF2]KPH85935.1 3-beta-hydroxy-delta(5)-steroid dehydrogenase [Komagataeibacter intermedius AF2]